MADKPHITPEGYVTRLVQVGVWATPHSPIQYAFLEQKPAYLPNEPGWTAFSAAQRAAVQQAFAMIAEVVTLTFVQVADNQQQPGTGNRRINFYANSTDLAFSGSMNPYQLPGSDAINGADIRFNTARIAQRQTNEHWQDFAPFVALHEVMHAVGLSHPGNYNGQGFNYQDHAEFAEDSIQYSVMSYFGAANTGADHFIDNVQYAARTPLLYDILALQSLYAPNMATRAGDTVYGFNSNTGASSPFNFAVTIGPIVAIWDAGGIDTIDLSGYSDGSLINLTAGEFSDAGGLTKNIAIAFGVTIENAVGGSGNDVIHGNSVANQLFGGAGNDLLDGREGADLLDGGIGADQMDGGAGDDIYVVDSASDQIFDSGGIDTLRTAIDLPPLNDAIENLELLGSAPINGVGNAQSNIITGNDSANMLDGRGGDDRMIGRGGDDIFVVDGIGDILVEQAGGGNDELRFATGFSAAVYTLPDQVERASLLGAAIGRLNGNASDNILLGNDATNILDGGAGIDTLRGGLGDDDYYLDQSGDVVEENAGEGIDTVRVSFAAYTLGANLENLTGNAPAGGQALTGNALSNLITGTSGNDLIDGGLGADALRGGGGDDIYLVDNGSDTIVELPGEGNDEVRTAVGAYMLGANVEKLTGTSGAGQALTGNDLANVIVGGAGDDLIDGGLGGDSMSGGLGNDVYYSDDAADSIVELAGEGVDEVRTSASSLALGANVETLTGTSNSGQSLTGNDLVNLIAGGAGNDILDGGAGADQLAGGAGNDIYVIDDSGDSVIEAAGGGTDEIRASLAFYALSSSANVENLTGTSSGGQSLTGSGADNIIAGGAGDDLIDGGGGADLLRGGAGNDVYVVDNMGVVIAELAGEGSDEVRTGLAAYSIAGLANVERLTGTSGSGQSLTGNGIANIIIGGSGFDTIDGGLGADIMAGGAGGDIYLVDDIGDTVVELAGGGSDEVHTSLAAYTLGAEVEKLRSLNPAFGQTLIGNGVDNVIQGSDHDDIIDGAGGADLMDGRDGNDVYYVDAAADFVTEFANRGTDEVRTALSSYALGGDVENLTGLGSGDQSLTGNSLANVINGGAGADTMAGGQGNDLYYVDNNADVVIELAGEGVDTIGTSLAFYDIRALPRVENLIAVTDNGHSFVGNGGDNLLAGAAGNDILNLRDGGNDTANGGAGNDVIHFGSTLTSADSVDGGAGIDQVVLQGNYAALLIGSSVVSIESLAILPGSDLRFGDPGGNFYSYNLGANNANVAAGGTMVVDANRLRLGENFWFDGSAETDGAFFIYGGGGTDALLGGHGNDTFYFGEAIQFGATDRVDGGAAGTDQLGLRGNYTIVFGANQLTSIESLGLVSAQDTRFGALGTAYNYNLTMNDGNLAAGARMTVDAAPLRGAETLTFDGGAELDGSFRIFGGQGADTIAGSQTGDLITGGTGADSLRGGGGADAFLYRSVADSLSSARDTIHDFATGDRIDLSQIDAISGGANDAFSFIGSGAFSGAAGELRATLSGGSWTVQGDVNGDGVADIELVVVSDHPIAGGDFVL